MYSQLENWNNGRPNTVIPGAEKFTNIFSSVLSVVAESDGHTEEQNDHGICSELVYWFNDVVIFGSDCDRFSSDNKGTGNP